MSERARARQIQPRLDPARERAARVREERGRAITEDTRAIREGGLARWRRWIYGY